MFTGRQKGDLTPTGTVVDASGGWWDAGDYLKFVQTTSYAEALMLVGIRRNLVWIGCSGCGTTTPQPCTTRWELAAATLASKMTTVSGDCRRRTTASVIRRASIDTSAIVRF